MADVNVLDLAEVTPSASSDDLILFDRTTGEAKAARYPTIGNAKLTIQKNGTTVKTFTANATSDVTCNITMDKGDVGLGNVGNFKAVSTAASQGLSATEQTNARNNISAGSASDVTAVANKVSGSSDAYSTSKAYQVGDYVIYNNVLYKCKTACSAAAWSTNSSCFQQDTLTHAVNKKIEFVDSGASYTITTKGSWQWYSSGPKFNATDLIQIRIYSSASSGTGGVSVIIPASQLGNSSSHINILMGGTLNESIMVCGTFSTGTYGIYVGSSLDLAFYNTFRINVLRLNN